MAREFFVSKKHNTFARKKHEMYRKVQKALDNQYLKLTIFSRQSEATKKWQNS